MQGLTPILEDDNATMQGLTPIQFDHCDFTGEKRYNVECGVEVEDGEYLPCSQEN
jgi:hypothetical protein